MANKKHLRKFGVNESILVRVAKCGYYHTAQLARSGYLFSCLITCANGYKIGHEKRINKVLFRASIHCINAVLARRAQYVKQLNSIDYV